MKLSIIIPYYNSADSIKELIESVLCEADGVQLIIVDDNSTKDCDEFEKIKNEYKGRVEFYINDSGVKGAGAARNIGLSHAVGEWLLFADADDKFLPGWYSAVREYEDKEYDIVYFNPTSYMPETDTVGTRHEYYEKYVKDFVKKQGLDEERYLRYFFIVPWSKLYRAEMVKEHNISFDEVMYSNDVMFSIKTGTYAKTIWADSRNIYCVVEKAGTLTQNMSEESWGIRHEVFSRRNLFLREHLNRNDFRFNMLRMGAAGRLVVAARRHCGFKNFRKYCKMYRDNKVPVFLSLLHTIKCHISVRVRGQRKNA